MGRTTPQNKDHSAPVLQRTVSLFPDIFGVVNSLLTNCTKGLTQRQGLLLWAIYSSGKKEDGQYLENKDIAEIFQKWFILATDTLKSEVSRTKSKLMDEDLVQMKRKSKRLYLTSKGESVARRIQKRLTARISKTLGHLNEEEMSRFLRTLERIIEATEKNKEKVKPNRRLSKRSSGESNHRNANDEKND